MARTGRGAKRRRIRDIAVGTFLFLLVGAIVAGAAYYARTRPVDVNPDTLCPANGPTGHFVLLVDKTDPLNFTQKQAFSVILSELIEKRLPEGYLLSVFALGEDFKQNAKPLIELCNPGTGADKSEYTSNRKKLRQQYESKFLEPLMKQADELLALKSAKTSPIIEMLQLVGINAFRKHDVKGERRLIVMSDMLQNTQGLSMYERPIDFPSFASSEYGRKSRADLPKVEVEIRYLMNTPHLQTRRIMKFWEDYFGNAGARIVLVQPMEG